MAVLANDSQPDLGLGRGGHPATTPFMEKHASDPFLAPHERASDTGAPSSPVSTVTTSTCDISPLSAYGTPPSSPLLDVSQLQDRTPLAWPSRRGRKERRTSQPPASPVTYVRETVTEGGWVRYEVDSGVRLAGGRVSAGSEEGEAGGDREPDSRRDDGAGEGESGSDGGSTGTGTLPPPYFSLSHLQARQ